MKKFGLMLLVAAFALGLSLSDSFARPPYKKEFDEKYVKKDSTVPAEKAFATAAEGAKCNVCHGKNAEGKDDKKVRNAYGEALTKVIMKNEKDKAKIIEALDKVAKEKSKADDANSPTFGALIAEGKLPSGN
jgi:hypothetical protein